MVKLEFTISDTDFDRLCAIKKREDKESLSINAFAKELLEHELYRQHPKKPTEDEL